MKNLDIFFAQSNLDKSDKEKALIFLKKNDDISKYLNESNISLNVGRKELFYIVCQFASPKQLDFQVLAFESLSHVIFEYGCIDSNIYSSLNKISNGTFEVSDFHLENIGYEKNQKGEEFGSKKVLLSFKFNGESFTVKDSVENPEFVLEFINYHITRYNLSNNQFYTYFTGDGTGESCIVFVSKEQRLFLDKYFKSVNL